MLREQLLKNIHSSAALIKVACGIGNNAAWLIALGALDHAKKCKEYRRVKHQFKRIVKMYCIYERQLIFADVNRMFHLSDLPEATRAKFGNISDREYYEFWRATGDAAYHRTQPLITSQWNKYRLSLVNHKIDDADNLAWVMTGLAALMIAVTIYESTIEKCHAIFNVPSSTLRRIFQQFSFANIAKQWQHALFDLAPLAHIDLSTTEEKNIDIGLRQILDEWIDFETLYESLSITVDNYDDVFSSEKSKREVCQEIENLKKQNE